MFLCDTHCHLDDDQLRTIQSEVIQRANLAGVSTMLAVAVCHESSQRCVELATRTHGVFASVGVHPNHCGSTTEAEWTLIQQLAVNHPQVVSIGETGLDRHWDDVPFERQEQFFDRHIRLSQQTGLPFIVHMRDCDEDVVRVLRAARERGPLRGVMHSFTGRLETAKICIELGMYISFAGMVTYKKSDNLRAIAREIPADRILVETDSPYLSPHPHRGRRPNEPAMIVHTAACLADVRKVSKEVFAAQTTQNAQCLFGWAN